MKVQSPFEMAKEKIKYRFIVEFYHDQKECEEAFESVIQNIYLKESEKNKDDE